MSKMAYRANWDNEQANPIADILAFRDLLCKETYALEPIYITEEWARVILRLLPLNYTHEEINQRIIDLRYNKGPARCLKTGA